MKINDEGKPEGTDEASPGEYTQDQLDEMLEHFIASKQIEADPKKLALLRDYAMSKNKAISDLFDVNNRPPVKSLKDLKKKYNEKVMEE